MCGGDGGGAWSGLRHFLPSLSRHPPPPPPPTPSIPTNPHQALTSPSHPTLSGPGPGLLQGRSATESEHAVRQNRSTRAGQHSIPRPFPHQSIHSPARSRHVRLLLACSAEAISVASPSPSSWRLLSAAVRRREERVRCVRTAEEVRWCAGGRRQDAPGAHVHMGSWCPCTHGKEAR